MILRRSAARVRVTEILEQLEERIETSPQSYSYLFGSAKDSEIRVANTRGLREKAWGLVHDAYVSKGYMEPCATKMRLLLHDALPEATTFLTEKRPSGQAVATLTMIPDGPLGLPMDGIYGRELAAMRAAGRRPCEIAKLVAAVEDKAGIEMLLNLFKLAYLTARRLENCTDFVITVNPRHEKYYRRLLQFERIGDVRAYDSVQGAPAVPLRLDLLTAETRYHEKFGAQPEAMNLFKFFVNDEEPAILDWLRLQREPMPEADFKHFFLERSDLLGGASPEHRLYLQCCYTSPCSQPWLF